MTVLAMSCPSPGCVATARVGGQPGALLQGTIPPLAESTPSVPHPVRTRASSSGGDDKSPSHPKLHNLLPLAWLTGFSLSFLAAEPGLLLLVPHPLSQQQNQPHRGIPGRGGP